MFKKQFFCYDSDQQSFTFSILPVDADWPDSSGASTVLMGIPDKSALKAAVTVNEKQGKGVKSLKKYEKIFEEQTERE